MTGGSKKHWRSGEGTGLVTTMRILIFGAGVIGSLYGALLAEAGYDVSVYARGRRLESLTQDGLLYKSKGKIRKAPIKVLSKIQPGDRYDLVFLTVRENQLHTALEELRQNCRRLIPLHSTSWSAATGT